MMRESDATGPAIEDGRGLGLGGGLKVGSDSGCVNDLIGTVALQELDTGGEVGRRGAG